MSFPFLLLKHNIDGFSLYEIIMRGPFKYCQHPRYVLALSLLPEWPRPALPCPAGLSWQCRCKLHSCTNLRFENQFLRYQIFNFSGCTVYTLTDFLTDSVWRQEKFRPLVPWFTSEYPRIDADLPLPMALTIAWMEDEKWISIQWLGWTILTSVNPRQSGTDTVTGWRIWGLMKQGQIL